MSGKDAKPPPAAAAEAKKAPEVNVKEINVRPRTSSSSSTLSVKTPRTARFAEATSVNSPIGPTAAGRNPFAGPPIITTHVVPQPQVSDLGFGYMSSNDIKHTSVEVPLTPKTPMRSALKPPGTPGRFIDPKSPTFHEEVALEKEELKTEKQNAADLKVKKRVRVAKFFLRGVNFSCSLIILAMISTTMTIFNATKTLPTRSNLPAWAQGQQTWPQITLLVIASCSLAICLLIFYSYWKGGHRKAEKTAFYYSLFALGFFVFSTVMWVVAAAILHSSKAHGNNQDMWGWSCNQNRRADLFKDEIDYALLCRLQNWALICIIIEVVVETFTITIYSVVLYRFWSKRKLHKSMNIRDKARSDLYLAQLRSQSAPNTPGLKSPMGGSFGAHVYDDVDAAEKGTSHFDAADAEYAKRHQSFYSQDQPIPSVSVTGPSNKQEKETVQDHMPAAPGEQRYDAVPIPGAYSSDVASPSFVAQPMHFPAPSSGEDKR